MSSWGKHDATIRVVLGAAWVMFFAVIVRCSSQPPMPAPPPQSQHSFPSLGINNTPPTPPMNAPVPSDYPNVRPGPPPPQVPGIAPAACEASQNSADRSLLAEARAAAMADASAFSRGQQVRYAEGSVSAEAPNIVCGSLYFDAFGGTWSYVYLNGRVHGRWRDPAEPQSLQARYCGFQPRTCD